MLQTLFYIPREVGGLPLFGFGLLLALWTAFSIILLGWLIYRDGWTPQTRSHLPVLLFVAIGIAFVVPLIAGPQGLPIRGYGTMLVLAVAAGCGLAARRAWRMGIDPEMILSLAFWIFLSGILGARLFYILEYWREFQTESWLKTLGELINVTKGGLVVYGALLAGIPTAMVFLRLHRLPVLALCDLVAPSIALGMGLGRLGCFLNGCCFAGPTELPWAVTFPAGSPPYLRQVEQGELYVHGLKFDADLAAPPTIAAVELESPAAKQGLRSGERIVLINGTRVGTNRDALAQLLGVEAGQPLALVTADDPHVKQWTLPKAIERSRPVHPAQLYSTVDGLFLCLFLLAYYPFRRRDGEVFALLLTLHPVSRILLEIIRTDESGVLGTGLSIAQIVSLLLLAAAAGLWIYLLRQPLGSALPVSLPMAEGANAAVRVPLGHTCSGTDRAVS